MSMGASRLQTVQLAWATNLHQGASWVLGATREALLPTGNHGPELCGVMRLGWLMRTPIHGPMLLCFCVVVF